MNRAWHSRHVMPKRATVEERITWHRAHQKDCGCRPVPRSLQAVMSGPAQRPSRSVIDAYLAKVSAPKRALLQKLRQTIRKLVPEAQECISYNLPAFRLRGRIVAGFAARGQGCSYYPFSGMTLHTVAADLKRYSQTKSALHFGPDKALPATLVRKLVKARIAEIDGGHYHARPKKAGRAT